MRYRRRGRIAILLCWCDLQIQWISHWFISPKRPWRSSLHPGIVEFSPVSVPQTFQTACAGARIMRILWTTGFQLHEFKRQRAKKASEAEVGRYCKSKRGRHFSCHSTADESLLLGLQIQALRWNHQDSLGNGTFYGFASTSMYWCLLRSRYTLACIFLYNESKVGRQW
jgi:hypothetical protein